MSHHMLDAVDQFHRAFDVSKFHHLDRLERLALLGLRATLIDEEAEEVLEALAADPVDQVHLAKELADLLYVAYGTADVLGLYIRDPFTGSRPLPFAAGLFLQRRLSWLGDELDFLIKAIATDADEEEVGDLIDDLAADLQGLVDRIGRIAGEFRIPINEVFARVHTSNMSKLNPVTARPERREDGKVVKGEWYHEPDLADLFMHPTTRIQAA